MFATESTAMLAAVSQNHVAAKLETATFLSCCGYPVR